ncbi:MAG: M23 family metallopeptidase [Elusimicrobiales bacterium]
MLVFGFSLFSVFSYIDYYLLKTENIFLKYKLASIVRHANEGLLYLNAVKRVDRQIEELTFYNKRRPKLRLPIGGPTSADSLRFSSMISGIDYSKLSNRDIIDAYKIIKDESEQRIRDYEKLFNYITSKASMINSIPKGWPVAGFISSPFGYRIHPFTLSYDFHSGVDIVNDPGTDIKVCADGVVRYTGWAMGYGLCVIVDHGFGYTTLYGHLSQVNVKVGDVVKKGSIIGKLGSTGTSTGPHLHYEVWRYGVFENPVKYINYSES